MTGRTRRRLPPLEERISFLVHRINAQMQRICNPRFDELGIDLVTSRMLVALLERGPMSLGDIVRTMALPQSTISHQVKRLEALGYLSRSSDPEDSRVIRSALTPRGREVAQAANALSRSVTDALLAAIGAAEVEAVRAALKRADAALAAMAPPPAGLRRGRAAPPDPPPPAPSPAGRRQARGDRQ